MKLQSGISLFFLRIKKLVNYFYCLAASRGDYIIINAWIEQYFGHVRHRNFGDELSYYLLKELTGKYIINYYNIPHLRKEENFLFIGSLVEQFVTPETVIWGSGALVGGNEPLKAIPKKVFAVRGKLTQKYLLSHGVDCPNVYGDPALLLPYVYKPNKQRKYRVGIIPHHSELGSPLVTNIIRQAPDDTHLINIIEYKSWQGVIDEICECDCILSSSLHGLIIADAYQIPNLWIKISDNVLGGSFKFLDYFSGVGRTTINPYVINKDTSIEQLIEEMRDYAPIHFNAKEFISVSPLPLMLPYDS